jgi:crotonobetaine/carnitine-CoA ligase
VGISSKFGEDEIKVYVVIKPGEKLEVEELIDFRDERMPHFWVPRCVEFAKELRRTSTKDYLNQKQGESAMLGIGRKYSINLKWKLSAAEG